MRGPIRRSTILALAIAAAALCARVEVAAQVQGPAACSRAWICQEAEFERTIDGKQGAAVYWIENIKPWETLHGPRGVFFD
jgi:hypothetical protein